MAACFALLGVVSLWRAVACDGGKIWYVPLVLFCAAGAMAAVAVRTRREKDPN